MVELRCRRWRRRLIVAAALRLVRVAVRYSFPRPNDVLADDVLRLRHDDGDG